MPKQILDDSFFDVEIDNQQLRLTQLKKRCFVLWLVCIGTWAVIEFVIFAIFKEYWKGEFRAILPTLYINLFIYAGMFTSVLLKLHKPKKNASFLWKIIQHLLAFVALYTLVIICFVAVSLILNRTLSFMLGLNQDWEIYISFVLSSGLLMFGLYFFIKPELDYEVNKTSK